MCARRCTLDLAWSLLIIRQMSHRGTKHCISAWRKSLSSIRCKEVTTCFASSSVVHRQAVRCLSWVQIIEEFKSEIICVHRVKLHRGVQVSLLGLNVDLGGAECSAAGSGRFACGKVFLYPLIRWLGGPQIHLRGRK